MKKTLLLIFLSLWMELICYAQVSINTDGSLPDAAAMLEVKSSSKGILPPRMTNDQMNLILSPPEGLLVYNTTFSALFWYNGTVWKRFSEPSSLIFGNLTSSDMTVTGGTGAVIGSGVTLTINKGNLLSNDITIANGAGAVLGTGTTLTIRKSNLTETGSSVLTITGGTNAVLGITGTTIQVKQAGPGQSGYLSSADWNLFNDKIGSPWTNNTENIFYNSGKVGIGTSAPAASALLEVSAESAGVLFPRMTADQRNAVQNPANGLMVFCTDCGTNGALSVYSNNAWRTYSLCSAITPVAGTTVVTPGQVTWNWVPADGAIGYKWGNSTTYSNATDLGNTLTKTETGITCGEILQRYVWSYNDCGVSEMLNLSRNIHPTAPSTPVQATLNSTQNSVTWRWNSVANREGYRWSNVNNFAAATEFGTDTVFLETGLTCGTIYTRYLWAYNGCGISAPLILTKSTSDCWLCGSIVTDSRDGQVYPTVQIGSQCWFAKSLQVGTMIDISVDQSDNGLIEKYCYYGMASLCDDYGGLYQWNEMMDYTSASSSNPSGRKGICPDGWHIPSDAEFCQMEIYLDSTVSCSGTGLTGTDIGGKLKQTGTVQWVPPNTGATNSSGFSALGSGVTYPYGFYGMGYYGYFWTATAGVSPEVYNRSLAYNSDQITRGSVGTQFGNTVRCVKDE